MPLGSVVTLEPARQEAAQSKGRRVVRVALVLVVLVPVLAFVVLDWRLATAPTRIDGVFDGLAARPPAATDDSVTILLLVTGDDQVDGPALAWMPGGPKVSSTLLVTIAGNRRQVAVDWLPMRGRVLAGLSERSPSQSVAGVETWTGRRVDHLGVVGWSAFADLNRANGGPDARGWRRRSGAAGIPASRAGGDAAHVNAEGTMDALPSASHRRRRSRHRRGLVGVCASPFGVLVARPTLGPQSTSVPRAGLVTPLRPGPRTCRRE